MQQDAERRPDPLRIARLHKNPARTLLLTRQTKPECHLGASCVNRDNDH
jgi:hypothetical protein